MMILKSYILICLTVIYSIASSGFSITSHYCGGKLIKVSLLPPKSCCKDGESSKGCCHNETKVCKLNDTHLQNHEFQNFQPIIAIVEPKENSFFQKTDIFLFRKVTPKVYHPPPLHLKTPIFIKNRVLII
jgi:hypothetical protein